MNLPIKIKNKKPWVSLSSYSSLLIDDINFSNYEICSFHSGPEGYFGRKHINNLIEAIGTEIPTDTTFYEDTLEVLFYNIESVIDKLIDYVFLTNPVSIVDSNKLDILLENAINKASTDLPELWYDSLIKKSLSGLISKSFLDYELLYDPRDKSSQCRVLFRYLPEGTERSVVLDLDVTEIPEDVNPETSSLSTWGLSFINHMKEKVEKLWSVNYDWKEDRYQRELYRSIMSNKGGVTIDDFYVKSFNLARYSNKINPRYVESLSNFETLNPEYLNKYSFNIISCIAEDSYNSSTVNPGFTHGIQGWNRESHLSQVTHSSHYSETSEFKILDTISNTDSPNPELHIDKSFNRFTQVNRVPAGKYELKLSLQTNVDRNFKIFLGDTEISFSMLANDTTRVITLTDTAEGGIDLSSVIDGIVKYGFEVEEVTDPLTAASAVTKIEYCRINKI